MTEISFADYFASGKFEEDIAINLARADLFEASDSLQRYYRKKHGVTNSERMKHEQRLYETAKKFVSALEARQYD